jgi:LmeA-like phospholipid-binding
VALAVLVALALVAVFVGDRVAVQRTESGISSRIETRVPGSHATVTISSSPFLVHLAASGTVQEVRAHVTGVTDGSLRLDSVDVTIRNLKISRTSLSHGSVRLLSLSSATITATLSVTELLTAAGYSLPAGLQALASGAIASVKAGSGRVQITFGSLTFGFPYGSLVPCVGSARVSGTEVILSCTTTTLPPALQTT